MWSTDIQLDLPDSEAVGEVTDGDKNCRLTLGFGKDRDSPKLLAMGSNPKCTENGGLPPDIDGLLLSYCSPAAIFAAPAGCLEGCRGKQHFPWFVPRRDLSLSAEEFPQTIKYCYCSGKRNPTLVPIQRCVRTNFPSFSCSLWLTSSHVPRGIEL